MGLKYLHSCVFSQKPPLEKLSTKAKENLSPHCIKYFLVSENTHLYLLLDIYFDYYHYYYYHYCYLYFFKCNMRDNAILRLSSPSFFSRFRHITYIIFIKSFLLSATTIYKISKINIEI